MALHSRPQSLKFLFSCSLIFCLTIAPVALAAYRPKNPSRPSGPTGTTGVRTGSCSSEATKGMLTVLAPLGHIGQTIAPHPTFAWYVPDAQPYPIEFRLYSDDSNGKYSLKHQKTVQSIKGIQQYTLPNDQVDLTIGQKYVWQVTLLCNSSDPSKDQVVRAQIEVAAAPTALQSSLAKTSDRLQRANLFAESGFWYDALAEALTDAETKPFSIALLKDLIKLEAPSSAEAAQQSDRLQQVILNQQ